MTLNDKESNFDKKVKEWAKEHEKYRQEYWGADWNDNEYWTYYDDEGQKQFYTEEEKRDYCFLPIPDGSINSVEYEKNRDKENSNRILFIAKEPHDPDGDIETYRSDKYLNCAPRFWNPAQRVVYGIFDNIEEYSKTDKNNYDDLKKAAYINVQKCRARSSTNSGYLRKWYLHHGCKELLEEQFRILEPNILICLNTCEIIWESIENVFDMKQYEPRFYNIFSKKQQLNEEAITSAYFTQNVLCIDCFHLSKPCLSQDVWGQGILRAFIDWKEYKNK